MRSKLGYQFQSMNLELLRQARPQIYMMIWGPGELPDRDSYHALKNEIGGFFVGRPYIDDALQALCLSDPIEGANQVFAVMLPTMERMRGIVDAWVVLNERGHHHPDIAPFVKASVRIIELCHQHGFKTVAGNWGSGNPDGNPDKRQDLPTYHQDPKAFMARLKAHWDLYLPILRATDYLGLHQYSWPTLKDVEPFRIGRHSLDWECWPADIQALEDWIIITEFGIDHGMVGPGLQGWRATGVSEENYRDQLMMVDRKWLIPWKPIKGALMFGAFMGPEWASFEVSDCSLIADYIRTSDYSDFIPQPEEAKPMNYTPGRTQKVTNIIVHHTGMLSTSKPPTPEQVKGWFDNSQVSAHGIIGTDGSIIYYVRKTDTAWGAAGPDVDGNNISDANDRSIHYELCGDGNIQPFTDAQYDTLTAEISDDRKNFPIQRILGHSEVTPGKVDPGKHFDWGSLRAMLDLTQTEPVPDNWKQYGQTWPEVASNLLGVAQLNDRTLKLVKVRISELNKELEVY